MRVDLHAWLGHPMEVHDIPDIICSFTFEDLSTDPVSRATAIAKVGENYRPLHKIEE